MCTDMARLLASSYTPNSFHEQFVAAQLSLKVCKQLQTNPKKQVTGNQNKFHINATNCYVASPTPLFTAQCYASIIRAIAASISYHTETDTVSMKGEEEVQCILLNGDMADG